MNRVQLNLLPDVKLDYLKAQHTRNLVVGISILVSAVALVIFLIMLTTVGVVQKKQLSDADKSIEQYSKQLQAVPNINKILTVQNQLQSLVTLHQNKHAVSRLFTYLPEVTPTNVNIGQISVDFSTNSMDISGTAASQQAINTFVDTLKFTTYKVGQEEAKPAFPSVVESSFGIDKTGASYGLSIEFDPILFSNNLNGQVPQLVVPQLTTTRSLLADPSNALFNGRTGPNKTQPGGR